MRDNVIQFKPKQPEVYTKALELFIAIADAESDAIDNLNEMRLKDADIGLYDFVVSILESKRNQTDQNYGYAFAGIIGIMDIDPDMRELFAHYEIPGYGTYADFIDAFARESGIK
jgi:hypothetical protein